MDVAGAARARATRKCVAFVAETRAKHRLIKLTHQKLFNRDAILTLWDPPEAAGVTGGGGTSSQDTDATLDPDIEERLKSLRGEGSASATDGRSEDDIDARLAALRGGAGASGPPAEE